MGGEADLVDEQGGVVAGVIGPRSVSSTCWPARTFCSAVSGPALDRLGLSDAELRDINPNLIYGSESYASLATPWVGRRGFEQIAQAVTGAMDVHSEGLGLEAPTVTAPRAG